MKRLLFVSAMFFPGLASAAFIPMALTTGPVNGSTVAVTNAVGDTLRVGFNGVAQPENQTQLNGTTIDTNSGTKSAGTQRIVIATDQPQLTNALKVDGSAVTQPVSAASLPLPTGAAVESGGNLATLAGGVSGQRYQVNVTSVNGTAIDTNSGTKSAGTIRVVLATDQPQNTNALKVDNSAVTQPVSGTVTAQQTTDANLNASVSLKGSSNTVKLNDGNGNSVTSTGNALDINLKSGSIANASFGATQSTAANLRASVSIDGSSNSVNMAQVGGTTVDTNTGNATAGTQRHVVATNNPAIANWGQGATGSAVPVNAVQVAGTDGTNLVAPYIDPCQRGVRTRVAINQTTGTQLIAGTSAKQTYICEMDIVVSAAQNVALVEGTGSVCATGIGGMAGGTTAATGWNLAANGGLVKGNGADWVYKTTTAADNVCILQSGAAQISGSLSYVQF